MVEAVFQNNKVVYTEPLMQYDNNQKLAIRGIELPEKYSVQFSNDEEGGMAMSLEGGTEGTIMIPNTYLLTGEFIYVWIFSTSEHEGNRTIGKIIIPVERRPAPLPTLTVPEGSDYTYVDNYTIEGESMIFGPGQHPSALFGGGS